METEGRNIFQSFSQCDFHCQEGNPAKNRELDEVEKMRF
jgi:hypothetical protein